MLTNTKTDKIPLLIKVCGLKDNTNLKAILSLKPDFVGFIFYPKSVRYCFSTLNINDIPISKSLKTGVFVNASLKYILDIFISYSLDIVQLHGHESPDLCRNLKEKGIKVIKSFSVGTDFNFKIIKPYLSVVDYALLDTKTSSYGGSGIAFNWDILANYPYQLPYFLSGGISFDHLSIIKNLSYPYMIGIDINSRFETTAGIKNIPLVKKFINYLR